MDINDPEARMNSLPPLLCSQCKEGDKGSKAVLRVTGFSSSDRMAPFLKLEQVWPQGVKRPQWDTNTPVLL